MIAINHTLISEDIFDKKFDENKMIESRKAFLKENSWENCAKKLIDIFNIAK